MVAHLHVENNFHFVTMERSSFSALENVTVSTIVPMDLMNGAVLKNVAALSRSKARSTNLVSLMWHPYTSTCLEMPLIIDS